MNIYIIDGGEKKYFKKILYEYQLNVIFQMYKIDRNYVEEDFKQL